MSLFREFAQMQRDMHAMMHAMDRHFGALSRSDPFFAAPSLMSDVDDDGLFPDAITQPQLQQQQQQPQLTSGTSSSSAPVKKDEEEKKVAISNQQQQQQQPQQSQAVTTTNNNSSQRQGWLSPWQGLGSSLATLRPPAIDVLAHPDKYVVRADLPAGVPKEAVKLELDKDRHVLTLSGQHSEEKETKGSEGGEWVRRERSSGSFTRSLRLPHDVELTDSHAQQLQANFKDGVLELALPRQQKEKADSKLKDDKQQIKIV